MASHASVSRKTLVFSWIVLVLLAGLAKAWLIVDHFMELRHTHQGWRLAMLGWPVVMALAIGLAFFGRLGAG